MKVRGRTEEMNMMRKRESGPCFYLQTVNALIADVETRSYELVCYNKMCECSKDKIRGTVKPSKRYRTPEIESPRSALRHRRCLLAARPAIFLFGSSEVGVKSKKKDKQRSKQGLRKIRECQNSTDRMQALTQR